MFTTVVNINISYISTVVWYVVTANNQYSLLPLSVELTEETEQCCCGSYFHWLSTNADQHISRHFLLRSQSLTPGNTPPPTNDYICITHFYLTSVKSYACICGVWDIHRNKILTYFFKACFWMTQECDCQYCVLCNLYVYTFLLMIY